MYRLLTAALILIVHANLACADALPPPNLGDGSDQEWWSEQDAGWLGGLIGGSAGILGAVVGIASGLGKARSFVLALAAVLFGFGVLLLLLGAHAVSTGQPHHVYFLFFMIGGVLAFVMGFNYPMLKRRYDQLDFQNTRSTDS